MRAYVHARMRADTLTHIDTEKRQLHPMPSCGHSVILVVVIQSRPLFSSHFPRESSYTTVDMSSWVSPRDYRTTYARSIDRSSGIPISPGPMCLLVHVVAAPTVSAQANVD